MDENEKYLKLLKADVEARLGRGLLSPKDFDYLHETIAEALNESVSVSTLKRLWGYSKYGATPRPGILSTLCRFVSYRDWEFYKLHREAGDKLPSAEVLSDKIDVKADLEKGDCVRLTWEPGRVCIVEYRGDGEFEVVSAANTGIKAGDLFCCSLIVAGEPLWLNNLRKFGQPPVAYVCGKQGGVQFEVMQN